MPRARTSRVRLGVLSDSRRAALGGARHAITRALGSDAWVRDASLLTGLLPFADDPAFRPGRRRYQRPNRRGRELRGDLQGDLPDLPRA